MKKKETKFKRNNVETVYKGTENLTFLLPRIWEIVSDYIKEKIRALRNLNWKQNYGILKTVPAVYAKGSYHNFHCTKSVQIRSFFSYLFGHFSRSVSFIINFKKRLTLETLFTAEIPEGTIQNSTKK